MRVQNCKAVAVVDSIGVGAVLTKSLEVGAIAQPTHKEPPVDRPFDSIGGKCSCLATR